MTSPLCSECACPISGVRACFSVDRPDGSVANIAKCTSCVAGRGREIGGMSRDAQAMLEREAKCIVR